MELPSCHSQGWPSRGRSVVWGWWKVPAGNTKGTCRGITIQSLSIYPIPAACQVQMCAEEGGSGSAQTEKLRPGPGLEGWAAGQQP